MVTLYMTYLHYPIDAIDMNDVIKLTHRIDQTQLHNSPINYFIPFTLPKYTYHALF